MLWLTYFANIAEKNDVDCENRSCVLSKPTTVISKYPSHLPNTRPTGRIPTQPFASLTQLTAMEKGSIINPNLCQIFYWLV